MSIEIIAIIAIVFAVMALALLFVLARRAMRFFVRLVLAGMMIVILVVGAVVSWWYVSGDTAPSKQNMNRPSNSRRASSR